MEQLRCPECGYPLSGIRCENCGFVFKLSGENKKLIKKKKKIIN